MDRQTVKEISAEVGDDPVKAQAALELEMASDDPRSTLIDHLQAIIDKAATAKQEPKPDGSADESATVWVIAHANVLGLAAGETGEVLDDDETQACMERGLVERTR